MCGELEDNLRESPMTPEQGGINIWIEQNYTSVFPQSEHLNLT